MKAEELKPGDILYRYEPVTDEKIALVEYVIEGIFNHTSERMFETHKPYYLHENQILVELEDESEIVFDANKDFGNEWSELISERESCSPDSWIEDTSYATSPEKAKELYKSGTQRKIDDLHRQLKTIRDLNESFMDNDIYLNWHNVKTLVVPEWVTW